MKQKRQNRGSKPLTFRSQRERISLVRCFRLESYMQFSVPHITALMLLSHLLFGCCWHHDHSTAHAENATDLRTSSTISATNHAHCHHHKGCDEPSDVPGDEDNLPAQRHCSSDQCSFVRTDSSPSQADSRRELCLLDVTCLAVENGQLDIQCACPYVDTFHDIGPPVRTHLLCGVLLI